MSVAQRSPVLRKSRALTADNPMHDATLPRSAETGAAQTLEGKRYVFCLFASVKPESDTRRREPRTFL